MRLCDLPVGVFNGEDVDNLFFVNYKHLYRIEFTDIFEWIKKEAIKNGLTVELKEDRIIFIKNEDTCNDNSLQQDQQPAKVD